MDQHRLQEERSIAYHQWLVEKMRSDPSILEMARDRVRGWLENGGTHPYYAERWQRLLALPFEEMAERLVDPGEEMRSMRQSTPFAGGLDPRERWRIWRRVKEEAMAS